MPRPTEPVRCDPRPGGAFRVEHGDRNPVVGEYVEVEPPRRVVFTWGYADDAVTAPGSTRVEVTLEPDGEGTRLTLLHHDLPEGARAVHAGGWAHFLGRLSGVAG
jgi:uncharacterized protein YndB with AHSA1/START domain